MHDLACTLRPKANGALTPPDALGPSRLHRDDPFPDLVADWTEVIAFDLTVNATSEEGVTSRQIYGPFVIRELTFRSGSAGGISQQLRFAVGDVSPAAQAVVSSGAGLPTAAVTDSSRTVGTFFATTLYERHELNWLSRTDLTRLNFILNNTTAAAVTVLGHVTLVHLTPRSQAFHSPRA